jgi:hypothetical protein
MSLTANQLRVDAVLRAYLASDQIQVGERVPPFPELARRVGTSVSVLQAVMPRLAGEGLLEVVPRVGTFLRRRPDGPGVTPHAGVALLFYVGEESSTVSPAWRRVVERFEELHPGVCIELSLSDSTDPLLRHPDLLLVNHRQAIERSAGGGFLDWADDGSWRVDERISYAQALWRAGRPRIALPVLMGTQVLFVARGGPPQVGTHLSELIASADAGAGYGMVITSYTTPLWTRGLGSGGVPVDDPETLAYLDLLASTPPPRLVMPCDFADSGPLTLLAPLVGRRCRYFLSSLWTARQAERGAWDLLPPPGTGPVECGAMSLMVAQGPRAEAAVFFARFIAGHQGQQILGTYDALFPTWRPALEGHRHAGLLAAIEARGHPRSPLAGDPAWNERLRHADRTLAALRVHRATVAEAMAAVVAVDRG